MRPSIWQAAALLYLVIPVVIFLAFFASYFLAAVGLCFIFWASSQFVRGGVERSVSRPLAGALLLLACLFIGFSGLLPPQWQTSDYSKHYGILRLLAQQHWPVVIDAGQGPEFLRYYLGWYLVPAGLCKLLHYRALDSVLAAWSALGLWLVFVLLAEALKVKSRWWALLAPVLFMFFSGLDQLGVTLSGHLLGYPDHFEWWATFYQYSSLLTDLVWAPQHGLAAWLAVGLLLNAVPGSRVITHVGLLFVAVCFWSPLCAMGVLPFVLLVARRKCFRELFSVSNVLALTTLAPPVLGYLSASTERIPHAWIFDIPGWTLANLAVFWLLEFGIFTLLIWSIGTPRKALLLVTVGMLLLIPLFSLGGMNDFAMRVSMAPLAALSFIGAEVILSKPWRATLPLIIVFVLGTGTPLAEISRGLRWASPAGRVNVPELRMRLDLGNSFRSQYVAPYPSPFLRKASEIALVPPPPPAPPAPGPLRRRRHKRPAST